MNSSLLAFAIAVAFASATSLSFADTTSTSTANGGAGGAGGAATGGTATGGAATNNTSGVSSASGGVGQGGAGGSAAGGTATASGGSVGTVSTGGSSASTGDITLNYNLPASPSGKAGLGVGVDPTTGHIMTDNNNNINYQGSYKVKNTPDVNIGGPASGPCNGYSGGLGVSLAGISVGANASTVDEGCSARETARVAAMIGRVDIANAILENLPIVQAALKAKAAREALALPEKSSETPATTAPAQLSPVPIPAPVLTQEQRQAALKEQQRLAQEALTRQATMAKVNDTLKFTDATTQSSEKTPQQIMAEDANHKLSMKAEEVKKPEPTVAAVASAPAQTDKSEMLAKTAETKASPESQTVNTPVVEQQGAGPRAVKAAESKVSPVAQTPEERVKAAKAALNLQ